MGFRLFLGGILVWAGVWTAVAAAQNPTTPTTPSPPVPGATPPTGTAPPRSPTESPNAVPRSPGNPAAIPGVGPLISESPTGPIYVEDVRGEKVLFPGITLEELDRLLDNQQKRRPQPPRFTILPGAGLTATIQGTGSNEAVAEVVLQFRIQRSRDSRGEEWVRIPVRMNQAILTPPVEHGGPGEFLTEFDPRDGYVMWLLAPPATEHTFTWRFKVPVPRKAGTRQLVLRTPDTPLTLQVRRVGSGGDARVNGSAGNILSSRRGPDGVLELVVDSAGGEIDLTWRDLPEPPPVIAALGGISVLLDGRHFAFDTLLTVRSFGPPIDSFAVRLPPGTELIDTSRFTQPGLEFAEAADPDQGTKGRVYVVRRLEGKTSSPIEARLRCRTSNPVVDGSAPWQMGGFEVLGARHQKGTLDFHAEGDWSLDWLPDANTRRVDDVQEDGRPQQLAARFEYDRQPFALGLRIREQETRVTVEPAWLVQVGADGLTLEGNLKYRMSGARAKPLELTLDMQGWRLHKISPSDLLGGAWKEASGRVQVPISAVVQGRGGEFELQLTASRTHSATGIAAAAAARLGDGAYWGGLFDPRLPLLGPGTQLLMPFREQPGAVSFPLPKPLADAGLPALAIVAPDDNIELVPQPTALRGLVHDTLPPEVKLPVRQQQPLVYREDAGGQTAEFGGQFLVRPQEIELTAETRLRVEERETSVEQKFQFTIAHEPVSALRLSLPRALAAGGRLELLMDGVAASWTEEPTSAVAPRTDSIPMLIALRAPRIGNCELVVRYRVPHDGSRLTEAVGSDPVELAVPLVQVRDLTRMTLLVHQLRVFEAANWSTRPTDGTWSPVDEEPGANSPFGTLYEAAELPTEMSLEVNWKTTPTKRATELLKLWVQATLTPEERRDRACFRLKTNESSLLFQLPPGARTAEITVAVDGRRIDRFTSYATGSVRVELGEVVGVREATIELWYWFPVHSVPFGRLTLQPPTLSGVSRCDQAYWELQLPRNEFLAWHGLELTGENTWERSTLWWGRKPLRDTVALESWIAASRQADPSDTANSPFNTYLFSSLGSLSPRTVYTVTRPFAVLVIGGLVLALGTLWLYVRALRHPAMLLMGAVVIAGVAIALPEPALAAAQLIVAGLGLVFLAGILRSFFGRPLTRRGPGRLVPSLGDSRTLASPSSRAAIPSSPLTTTLLPNAMPASAAGTEP